VPLSGPALTLFLGLFSKSALHLDPVQEKPVSCELSATGTGAAPVRRDATGVHEESSVRFGPWSQGWSLELASEFCWQREV